MTFDIRLARKDVTIPNPAYDPVTNPNVPQRIVDRVKVMEQIAKQTNTQAGYEMLRVVIPVDANGQPLSDSASLVAVTGEPFEVVDLPLLDPNWGASYTPGIAAQMGIHGGVTSNLAAAGIRDDMKMSALGITTGGTIRFESLGHSVEIDVSPDDTVKTIMDRLRSQAGDWLYVNYFDAKMGNSAGQEGDFPIISIAAKDGSAVNVVDAKGEVAQTLMLNTSIQGTKKFYDASGDLDLSVWNIPVGNGGVPLEFSISVAGYTHTIDLTAMRDINGNGVAGEACGVTDTDDVYYYDGSSLTDISTTSDNAVYDGSNILEFTGGAWVSYGAYGLLGASSSSTPYRGGYDLENASRTAPGIYTQNVVTRSGSNRTQQNFFGVIDDISAAVRAENRDGLGDRLLPIIDNFMDALLRIQSTSGALQARYESNVTRLKQNDLIMTEAHDELVGVDLTDIATQMMMAQALYQASLGVISYIVQPSLLNFLR